ncbi:electron transport complex subunit RsxG [Arenimonas sp.]|uniref:electron transport complex subunit RsxG n=1 Tax=Arenimonas sp. TaxID=1872635 RepID=UPI002E3452E9|nr:electron transport complex subunit RsxG [Arenimonas sp.]HEX4853926.1 electron transport complex subunit RsxG [Arenimonas sp.]
MNEGTRESLRAGLQLGLAALVATALLAGTYFLTRDRIAAAEHRARMQALEVVLPAARYDNDPLADTVQVQAPAWLGDAATTVHRATLAGAPSALVFETVAPDGYGGPIRLLLAIGAEGRVLGVRVTAHRETPGLGDDIEAGRSDWITRFQGRALGDPPAAGWAVRKDGGDFDQFAGATVTPRAVVRAVHRALEFTQRHGDGIRTAAPGATLRIPTAPDAPRTP